MRTERISANNGCTMATARLLLIMLAAVGLLCVCAGCITTTQQAKLDKLWVENRQLVEQIKDGTVPWKDGMILLEKNQQEIRSLSSAGYSWVEIAGGVLAAAFAAFTGIRLHRGPSHRGLEVVKKT